MVAAAAREFEDAEAMMTQTEALYGPYRWGRYDVLVLPPSFPFGGMENPRLTFMTPTVIAGDKSLVGVLAHELAHSWSGNLVTNATWRDGWLNEGFTTYFERRIMEAVYGEERARTGMGRRTTRTCGWRSRNCNRTKRGKARWHPTCHCIKDEEGSAVAYEKGALFLYQLERRFGRAQLDAFLQGWFDRHAFTSVTTPQFVAELQDGLMQQSRARSTRRFSRPGSTAAGLPADAEFVQSDTLARVDAQRLRWEQGSLTTDALQTAGWTVQEWLHFLNRATRPQPVARLQELDRRFQLTESSNAEIAHAWFRLALASDYPGTRARTGTLPDEHRPDEAHRARCMKTCCRLRRVPSSRGASTRRRAAGLPRHRAAVALDRPRVQ